MVHHIHVPTDVTYISGDRLAVVEEGGGIRVLDVSTDGGGTQVVSALVGLGRSGM